MLVRPKVFSRKKKRRVGSLKKNEGIGENTNAHFLWESEKCCWFGFICTRKKSVINILTELTAVFLLIRVGIAKKSRTEI